MSNFEEVDVYFKLYATCIPTKGAKRGIIADLSNGQYRFIPLLLIDVIILCKTQSVSEVKIHFNNSIDKGIDLYLDKLESEGWGFYTKEPFLFPELSLEWDSPLPITNFICDYNECSNYDIFDLISQVQDLNCEAIQFRFFCAFNIDVVRKISEAFFNSCIAFSELIGGWNEKIKISDYITILKNNPRIRRIVIHSAPFSKVNMLSEEEYSQKIVLIEDRITSHQFCGIVHENLFAVNLFSFTESVHFNSCLNRKLSIDVNGYIKNCPSMNNSFGHISDIKLIDVIKNERIKHLWFINKDQIRSL